MRVEGEFDSWNQIGFGAELVGDQKRENTHQEICGDFKQAKNYF